MPRLKIWNDKQIRRYEHPPKFTAQERKVFLTVPAALKPKYDALQTVSNKVGFALMVGYFLVRKRFFAPDHFHQADIGLLCNRLGVLAVAFDADGYKGTNYARHRRLILEAFAFEPFDGATHEGLITQTIQAQVYSYEEPALILDFMLEWLQGRRIELPPYHALQDLLTRILRQRNRAVSQKLESLLEPVHRDALDVLLEKPGDADPGIVSKARRGDYLLTRLRQLSPAETPKQIRANLEKLRSVQALYQVVQPVLDQLPLNDSALRFFGELVLKAQPFQIQRRNQPDKYFLLAAFCAYQVRRFEDWMVDTLLSVSQSFINKATRAHQQELFTQRKIYKSAFRRAVTIAENQTKLIHQIRDVIWGAGLSNAQKLAQLKRCLPRPRHDEADEDPTVEQLQQLRQAHHLDGDDEYYRYLEDQSLALQHRSSPIIKQLTFNRETSDKKLWHAIEYFRQTPGPLTKTAPTEFLSAEEQGVLLDAEGHFKVSLYKMLLFRHIALAIKSGSLNLSYSYRYKAFDEYLIAKKTWDKQKDQLLEQANLAHLKDVHVHLAGFRQRIDDHFHQTNSSIVQGQNPHFRMTSRAGAESLRARDGRVRFHIKTPKLDERTESPSLLPAEARIPLSQILATVDQVARYLEAFRHVQPHYRKRRPDKRLFLAAITAYGCNLGLSVMSKATLIETKEATNSAAQLENVANAYFSIENIERANDLIAAFTHRLDLANRCRTAPDQLYTASDGLKIKLVSSETIYATYSFKYFGQGKGVTAYSFVDERSIPFYSTIINSSEREATYVLDGLLHNEAIRSTIHATDTHGFTEALFGLMDLLGFGFAPHIAKLYKQQLYSFKAPTGGATRAAYAEKAYPILPAGYINTDLISSYWDGLLRLVTSLKLKYCTASQVFKRFNSYSRQHPLYTAVKEYGRMPKTLHVLRFIDDVEMRQHSRKSLNMIEADNRFSRAVFFNNGGEMIFLTRSEQRIAEACKRLIKNAIVCWNYLYLTRRIQQSASQEEKQALLQQIQSGSTTAWRHVHFSGYYDYSDENLSDSFDLLRSQNYALDLD